MQLQKEEVRQMALAERRRMADTLAELTPVQWDRQSLCKTWSVRDVAAHVAARAGETMPMFLLGMALAGFDNDRYNLHTAARWAQLSDSTIVELLRGDRMMRLMRAAPHLALVDNVVHHQDIRRPLRLGTDVPEKHLLAALDLVTTKPAFSTERKRAEGRRLVATDVEWTYGEGRELAGTGEALLMYVMGRDQVLPELDDAVPGRDR